MTLTSMLLRLIGSVAAGWWVSHLYAVISWFDIQRERTALKHHIEILLPNLVEVMALYMAVGLELSEAVNRSALALPEPARTEFLLVANDLRLGMPIAEVMSKFVAHTGCQDGRALSLIFQQASRFGTETVSKLHQLAVTLRDRRLAELEKAAKSVPIKLLIPLVIFVFPAVMIVLMTPILIRSGLLK